MFSVKLWHLPISHFNEKARWALDYKGVEHERLAPLSGPHMAVALWLTRGRQATLPVAEINGRRVGDSTAIIATLEESFPEPPLYPADPEERRRALELEDWFGRELGPPIRQLVWHEFGKDREKLMAVSATQAPEWMAAGIAKLPPRAAEGAARAGASYGKAFTALRFKTASAGGAERSREDVLRALDRLEAELDGNDYLVGDRFTVADLTAASLFYPLALPQGAPVGPELMPDAYNRFREGLRDRPGYRWVEEMYRRHRARPDA
jgi:glutathione S-transferase